MFVMSRVCYGRETEGSPVFPSGYHSTPRAWAPSSYAVLTVMRVPVFEDGDREEMHSQSLSECTYASCVAWCPEDGNEGKGLCALASLRHRASFEEGRYLLILSRKLEG